MQPSKLQEFVLRLRDVFDQAAREGEMPVLVTSSLIRQHVRAVVERFRPQTAVLAQGEVHPRMRLKALASL
jgi:flagellar biosynthesis protein FlhA